MRLLIKKKYLLTALICTIAFLSACAERQAGSIETTSTTIAVAGGNYQRVSASQLSSMLARQDYLLINTHIPYAGELAGTDAFLPYNQPDVLLAELPKDRQTPIVLYCRTGHMSAIAAETVVQAGYTNVYDLEGGMVAWEAAGLPLQRK